MPSSSESETGFPSTAEHPIEAASDATSAVTHPVVNTVGISAFDIVLKRCISPNPSTEGITKSKIIADGCVPLMNSIASIAE